MKTDGSRKRKRNAATEANPETPIPDKLYFRIGEVARLLSIAPHVLRFWEGEFPQLHPTKGGTGQRLYRRRDVETALRIKHLLYDEGYTIPGARQLLKADPGQNTPELPFQQSRSTPEQQLRKLRSGLAEIAGLLARPAPGTRRISSRNERRGLHLAQRRESPNADSTKLFHNRTPQIED